MSDHAEEIKEGGTDLLKDALIKLYKNMSLKRIRMPPRFDIVSRLWLRDAPFYSEFMMRFNFFETEGIDTFAVNCINGRINLYFNPKFLDGGMEFIKYDKKTHKPIIKRDDAGNVVYDESGKITYETEVWEGLKSTSDGDEVEAILIHEIMHLVLLTQERALDDADVWNIASDMIINDMITKMTIRGRNLPLPYGAIYLSEAKKRGYEGPDITEDLYHWLIGKRAEMQKSKTCPKCGGEGKQKCETCGGTGKDKKGNSCPQCEGTGKEQCDQCDGHGQENDEFFESIFKSNIDNHDLLRDNDNLTESILDDIIKCAQVKGWGEISGNGLETLKELLKPAKVNWKRELRQVLSSSVHGYGSNRSETWIRPNRRNLPLPGNRQLENKIYIAIDTSGSIGKDELEQFFAEIESIIRDFSKMTILQWDTEIKSVTKNYRRGKWNDVEIKGRGGTDPQCIFNWIEENKAYKYPVVILTDGYFSENFNPYRAKIIWCVTEDRNNPPHGRVIHININDNK